MATLQILFHIPPPTRLHVILSWAFIKQLFYFLNLYEPIVHGTFKTLTDLVTLFYTVFQKSDAKIQITITTTYLMKIKYPLSSFNYHLSDVSVANFNKIHCTVSEEQLF